MAKDQDLIHIYGGEEDTLWLAPLGTTLPVDLTTPLPAAWEDTGYNDEAGFDLNREDDVESFRVHQGGKIVRKKVTSSSTSLVFRTVEDNALTVRLADNVKSTTEGTGIVTRINGSAREVQAFAFVLDVFDGAYHKRTMGTRLEVAGGGTETFSNSALTVREFTGEIIGDYITIETAPAV